MNNINGIVIGNVTMKMSYNDEIHFGPEVSLTAGFYVGYSVQIIDGTGLGQNRIIMKYNNMIARIIPSWDIRPDETSKYLLSLDERDYNTGYERSPSWSDIYARADASEILYSESMNQLQRQQKIFKPPDLNPKRKITLEDKD